MMANAINASLSKISDGVSRLNQTTDDIAAKVKEVEEYLQHLNVGVHAEFLYSEENCREDGTVFTSSLAYTRCSNGEFRIAVIQGEAVHVDFITKPWAECSRHVKIESAKYLPDLLGKIADEVNKGISVAEDTKRVATDVASALSSDGRAS